MGITVWLVLPTLLQLVLLVYKGIIYRVLLLELVLVVELYLNVLHVLILHIVPVAQSDIF